jgi:hypothetical protein
MPSLGERHMYDVFDSFLSGGTWHTQHPTDEKTFFLVLQKVVRDKNFSPDVMGEHMRGKLGVDRYASKDATFSKAIDHYVSAAWAVKDYLRATE